MTPAEWGRVKAVVGDALEREPDARDAFVATRCCEDNALRREVESMLRQSGHRIDRCVERLSQPRTSAEERLAGVRLGAYEVLREVGRGGMGAVYLARRADEQFEKQVAIKILKRGTDTDEVLRRFRAERQILARLEHANVAQLLDAGTTGDGLPYFVMEYVNGSRITEFCRLQNLNIRQRVELFLKVCAAVHFAHQNLVVHRDPKPGNILVTPEGEPKLLDFGIAKLLSPDDDFAEITVQDQQRFTPAYASPEQVRGEPVTTVSDVYALGAVLYELLAGEPPHRFASQPPSATELFRVIVEHEVPRASSIAPTPEARRQLRGDLDKILLTALRKEPERRYSGVPALAEDLRRFLGNRPVRARPATLHYRACKFIARNKFRVAAAVLLLLTLLGGIASTVRQKERAERRFREVRKLARAVVFDYHDLVAPLRGSTPVRERLVKDALEYLDSLSREAGSDDGLLRELATAYQKVAQVQGNSYYANLGDTTGATRSYRRSLDIREALLNSDPENHELQDETAKSHEGLGDTLYTIYDLRGALASYENARELRERTIVAVPENTAYRLALAEVYSKLGDIKGMEHYANLGDIAGGLASCRKAQELLEPLYATDPQNRDLTSRLANVLTHVGMLSCTAGDVANALIVQRRAVEMLEQLSNTYPDNQSYAGELLAARHWLRYALEDDGQLAEAIGLSRRLVADLQRMLSEDPKNSQLSHNLSVSYNTLGKQLLLTGDVAGALESHRTALTISEESMAANSDSEEVKSDVALSLNRLGQAEAAAGNHHSAAQNYRKALALREPTLAANPTNSRAGDDVSSLYADIGRSLAAMSDFGGALESFGRSLPLAEKISAQAPTNARLQARLARRYSEVGRVHLEMTQPHAATSPDANTELQRACDYLNKSRAIWQDLRDKGTLIPADAAQPDEVARELVRCEVASKRR